MSTTVPTISEHPAKDMAWGVVVQHSDCATCYVAFALKSTTPPRVWQFINKMTEKDPSYIPYRNKNREIKQWFDAIPRLYYCGAPLPGSTTNGMVPCPPNVEVLGIKVYVLTY